MVIVLMGPAGAGKSTVGEALGARLGWPFVDADDYHSPANVAKMHRGEPLTDRDRAAWLASLHRVIALAVDRRESIVLACSALTAHHRELLKGTLRPVRFVYLKNPPEVLQARLQARRDHFAGAALLDSQLATLEEPGDAALVVDGTADLDTIIGRIRLEFGV
jgi:gluconokinase